MRSTVPVGLSRKVFVAHEDEENPMNIESILKNCWRPVVGGVLGCILGAAVGCVAGVAILGIYSSTFSPSEFKQRFGDMIGVEMIVWGFFGILIGAVVLGALGVWREIWLNRAGRRTSRVLKAEPNGP